MSTTNELLEILAREGPEGFIKRMRESHNDFVKIVCADFPETPPLFKINSSNDVPVPPGISIGVPSYQGETHYTPVPAENTILEGDGIIHWKDTCLDDEGLRVCCEMNKFMKKGLSKDSVPLKELLKYASSRGMRVSEPEWLVEKQKQYIEVIEKDAVEEDNTKIRYYSKNGKCNELVVSYSPGTWDEDCDSLVRAILSLLERGARDDLYKILLEEATRLDLKILKPQCLADVQKSILIKNPVDPDHSVEKLREKINDPKTSIDSKLIFFRLLSQKLGSVEEESYSKIITVTNVNLNGLFKAWSSLPALADRYITDKTFTEDSESWFGLVQNNPPVEFLQLIFKTIKVKIFPFAAMAHMFERRQLSKIRLFYKNMTCRVPGSFIRMLLNESFDFWSMFLGNCAETVFYFVRDVKEIDLENYLLLVQGYLLGVGKSEETSQFLIELFTRRSENTALVANLIKSFPLVFGSYDADSHVYRLGKSIYPELLDEF